MSDTSTQPTPPAPPPPPAPTPPPADNKLDQGHVNKLVGDARKEGRDTAARELAEKLGMSVDDAAAKIKALEDAETAKLSEADKKLTEATKATEKANAETASARAIIVNSLKRDALIRLGMSLDQADAAKHLVNIEGDLTAEDAVEKVTAAAQQVKTTFPQLFTGDTGAGDETHDDDQGDDGTPPPPGGSAPFPPRDSTVRGRPAPSGQRDMKAIQERNRARLVESGLVKPSS